MLGYELGEAIEPRVADVRRGSAPATDRAADPEAVLDAPPSRGDTGLWPRQVWYRVNAALVFDHARSRWWSVGEPAARAALASRANQFTMLAHQARLPHDRTSQDNHHAPDDHDNDHAADNASFHLAPVDPAKLALARTKYTRNVARVLDHISQGDAYQVNLAHPLDFRFTGDPRALFLRLCEHARPRMAALIPMPDAPAHAGAPPTRRVVVSASPEIFLSIAPSAGDGASDVNRRTITAVPMKGTRALPGPQPEDTYRELLESPKDRAELTMIVDLMRNDLGRICIPATVRVRTLREIEHHGGDHAPILQATSTIEGFLRPDASLQSIIRAVFPPGSVTGAPKVRAMQIIRALEPSERAPYCGAIGYLSDSGHASFSVAIRSACIEGPTPDAQPDSSHRPAANVITGTARWWVGAGIVAQSDPELEWQETLVKARAILDLCSE